MIARILAAAVLLLAAGCGSSDAKPRHAELTVVSGATTVTIRAVDLGMSLYRAEGAHAEQDGDAVRVSLRSGDGPDVRVDVATGVSWTIRLDGGATEETVDFADGALAALEFGAGATRIDATLPVPSGMVPVRMTGGASTFSLHLPSGVPASVRMAGGGGQASIDGVVHTGVAGGSRFATQGWVDGAAGYAVDAVAGVSALVVDRTP